MSCTPWVQPVFAAHPPITSSPNHTTTRDDDNAAPVKGYKVKRGNFVAINQRLIASAETGNVEWLMSTIESSITRMNLVNISTGLHRLAKLTSSDANQQERVRRSPVLAQMLAVAEEALSRFGPGSTPPHSQVLSNMAWAFATLQVMTMPLLEKLADLACKQFLAFKPFELSSVLWAFAKFDAIDTKACRHTEPLFTFCSQYIPSNIEKFSFRCLVMTAGAFASAGHHDASLFRRMADSMVVDVFRANSQELSSVVWAYGTAGVSSEPFFMKIAQKGLAVLPEFRAHELVNILWGFTRAGYYHEEFFTKAADLVQSCNTDMEAKPLADMITILSKDRPRHPSTRAILLAVLPRCASVLHNFTSEELASVASAVGRCFGSDSNGDFELPAPAFHFFRAALPWAALRPDDFEPSVLLLFLHSNLSGTATICASALRALFLQVGRQVHLLHRAELKTLSLVIDSCKGMLSPQDLHSVSEKVGCALSDLQVGSWVASSTRCSSISTTSALSSYSPSVGSDPELQLQGGDYTPRSGSEQDVTTESESDSPAASFKALVSQPLAPQACSPADENLKALTRLRDNWSASVKNTFLYIQEPIISSDVALLSSSKSLEPALKIIQSTVSPDHLQAYRSYYRSCRSRHSGAVGELPVTWAWSDESILAELMNLRCGVLD